MIVPTQVRRSSLSAGGSTQFPRWYIPYPKRLVFQPALSQ